MTVAQNEGLRWLTSLPRFGIRPGLTRTIRVLEELGRPDKGLQFYHVAGTNGKGSVCAYLHSILTVRQTAGLFTSPAYDGFRARFRIGAETIGAEEFAALAEEVMQVANTVTPTDPITEFEALTVMAILYFARHQVNCVVWETGLGGRYDSTNVVTPRVTCITNVGLDHTEILGNTVRAIASDKAGIVKPSIPVVTGTADAAALEVRRQASEAGAPLYALGQQFGFVREQVGKDLQRMTYRGLLGDVSHVEVPLFGAHQCTNAALALAMYEAAVRLGEAPALSAMELRSAIRAACWPGRFERIWAAGIPIVLDGAHNADGARAFAHALGEYNEILGLTQPWTMVVGVLADKDIRMMMHEVLPWAGRVYVVAPENARAVAVSDLAAHIRSVRPDIEIMVEEDVAQGLSRAIDENNGEPLCCWGSLYTVDAAREALRAKFGALQGSTG